MTVEQMSVRLPIVRREKEGLVAEIADHRVRLSNQGGRLDWLSESGVSLQAELMATLETTKGPVEIRQAADQDPRLVVCEQGPVRIVLRAQFDLLDEAGTRWGEGLTEWALYSDETVVGVVSLRFVNADMNARLKNAELCLTGVGEDPQQLILEGSTFIRTDMQDVVPFSAMISGIQLGSHCASWRDGRSSAYADEKGPWHGFGDDTPYYEDWGTLPNQGWGDSGWSAGQGAGLYLDLADDHLGLAFIRDEAGQPLPAVYALQGQLLVMPSENPACAAKAANWREPSAPTVTGAEYRGCSLHDAAHMIYAPSASELSLEIAPSGAPTAAHIYGLSHWGGWEVTCDGVALLPQLVNDGRGCDDPNGLQLGRFDDRHGPIIGRTDTPANRLILLVPPGDKPREVTCRAVEGLALSYLRWDDRKLYLLQSSANTNRNLGELVVRDGKLRNLVAVHSAEVSIAAMPLYWYQCNTPTPYMAVDDIREYIIKRMAPDVIEFEVHSRSRFGCAEAVYSVRVPFDAKLTRVDVSAELNVLKAWEFSDLQLLNMFAEEFRDHSLWPHEYALAMDSVGRRILKKPRQGRQVVEGEFFSDYTPPLLFAQYSAARGNVFLGQTRMEGPVTCQHFLCPHWIDSHYHVVSESGRLKSGDRVRGAYVMIVDDGRDRETKEIEEIAKGLIDGRDLGDLLA